MKALYIILIIILLFFTTGCVQQRQDNRMHVLVEDNQTKQIYELFVYSETNDYYYGYVAGELPQGSYWSKGRFKYLGGW